jgi:hypothetical protein
MQKRSILAAVTFVVTGFFCGWLSLAAATQDNKAPELSPAAVKKISHAIAHGHSYQKHVIDENLFPAIKSKEDFQELIAKVLTKPTHHRNLENDRQAFYDKKTNTIVIYNPHAKDNGTCFRPNAGLKYFENLK